MYIVRQLPTRQCTEIAYTTRRPTDMNYNNIIIEKYYNIIIPTTPSKKTLCVPYTYYLFGAQFERKTLQ